jgi:hypothetical protein
MTALAWARTARPISLSNNWWDCDRSLAWLSFGRRMPTRQWPHGESPLAGRRAGCSGADTPGTSGARPEFLSRHSRGSAAGRLYPRGFSSPGGRPPDIILIATGSEVHLALEGRDRLASGGVHARVVSMPSTNLFASQPDDYREKVLPRVCHLLVIEAGSSLGWRSYVGPRIAVIGIDTFGCIGSRTGRDGALRLHCGERLQAGSSCARPAQGESIMRVGIASDHGGFALKEQIANLLRGAGS